MASSDSGGERFDVRAYDIATSTWQTLIADSDADLAAFPDASGQRWAVVRSRNGVDELTIRTGDVSTDISLPAAGVLTFFTDLHWSPDGSTLALTFASPTSPPEAYTWSAASGLVRRTVSNDEALLPTLPAPQLRHVESFDGEQVPVFLWQSDDPDGSAVVYIHGGPEGVTVLSWNPVAAALCQAGHTVALPNVRGSAGHGRRWVSLDDVEKRLDSVADLAAIHDWLPTVGVDAKRAALFGGSYGGYMVLAGLTFQPDRWAGGVDIVGISSLVTFLENTSAYRRAYREREYGSLAEHRDILEAASPLPIIDRLQVPLFIIHGRNDPRVPLSEAEQVAAAVRANGAECELVVYDDEGHGLAKRANRLDAYPRVADFLARVLA
jgi:dipeptidyl aminopeptidase/acylaminoacyl peptidase